MSAEDKRANECGICLEALNDSVTLPCSHQFCAKCLDEWKSKYGRFAALGRAKHVDDLHRKCPLCRERLPPSREMIVQLNYLREQSSQNPDSFHSNYLEVLEAEIGEWDGTTILEDSSYIELPKHIANAFRVRDIGKVMPWLDQGQGRINARCPSMHYNSLLHGAVNIEDYGVISILLQKGADVNLKEAIGNTPLNCSLLNINLRNKIDVPLLLLEWGAETDKNTDNYLASDPHLRTLLGVLLKSEFGGRRCEIVNFACDWTGKTCIVGEYLPARDRYKIMMEFTKENLEMSPQHLKRRDRTPEDPGYYVEFQRGKTIRQDFKSNEDCQAYVATLNKKNALPAAISAEAEARAQEAAASLLAELGLQTLKEASAKDVAPNKPGKGGGRKKKGKNKKKRGKK